LLATLFFFALMMFAPAGKANADLSIDRVLSLEWLVDSADAIYLGRFVAGESDRVTFHPDREVKSQLAEATTAGQPHHASGSMMAKGDRHETRNQDQGQVETTHSPAAEA
jgi:hypothetical protein